MLSKVQVLVIAAVLCLATVSCYKRQGYAGDSDVAATSGFSGGGGGAGGGGGGGGSGGDGKFFQYAHHPEHDLYEMGYHRGNHHHFRERHEKAAPHAGHFKTKVRWGDKKGGHGEHLWDYNHDGHHDEHGGN
ncbi:POU domain, class 3, transcription factor 3-like isoform X2 [Cloeon dipterum]|uniref:Uncharacterized protein n=1 Tax=Cloeon dipterum TaxID=197152 RepID=A0A8S1CMX3_9INSE|nr:Hypothetical predicted protein [Cloeon dipterum]